MRQLPRDWFLDSTGTGLDLAICRAIAELHEGTTVTFNRAEGGAAFRVRIPVVNGTPDAAAFVSA